MMVLDSSDTLAQLRYSHKRCRQLGRYSEVVAASAPIRTQELCIAGPGDTAD